MISVETKLQAKKKNLSSLHSLLLLYTGAHRPMITHSKFPSFCTNMLFVGVHNIKYVYTCVTETKTMRHLRGLILHVHSCAT